MPYTVCPSIPEKSFLNIPVSTVGTQVQMCLRADGVPVKKMNVTLSETPLMWGVLDLSGYAGQELTAEYFLDDDIIEPGEEIKLLQIGDAPADEKSAYNEVMRPIAHFSCRRGYHNDPNGMYYYNGEYHMFFQLNPFGLGPGNTSWGHAVSRDLIHWEEKAVTLSPSDSEGNMFSGSGVVDYDNTSGLQEGEDPPALLFYTATGFRFRGKAGFPMDPAKRPPAVQRIAVSTDGGKTFRKLEGEPAVPNHAPINRDPKVQWLEEAGCWVMLLYLEGNDYQFFYSDDLLHWEDGQVISPENTGECPDLFPLCVDGDPAQRKWVILGSPCNYIVGHFEGRKFIWDTDLIMGPTAEFPRGGAKYFQTPAYAPQTFFGAPDGRIVQISWMQSKFPGMPFNSCMSLPWELKLVSTPEGPRMTAFPVEETHALENGLCQVEGRDHLELNDALGAFNSESLRLDMTFKPEKGGKFAFALRGVTVSYDSDSRELLFPTGCYTLPEKENGEVNITLIVDRGSAEIFAQDGLFNGGHCGPMDPSKRGIKFYSLKNGHISARLTSLGIEQDPPRRFY